MFASKMSGFGVEGSLRRHLEALKTEWSASPNKSFIFRRRNVSGPGSGGNRNPALDPHPHLARVKTRVDWYSCGIAVGRLAPCGRGCAQSHRQGRRGRPSVSRRCALNRGRPLHWLPAAWALALSRSCRAASAGRFWRDNNGQRAQRDRARAEGELSGTPVWVATRLWGARATSAYSDTK